MGDRQWGFRLREGLADSLRIHDAEARGVDSRQLLSFGVLSEPERNRWKGMADTALEYLERERVFEDLVDEGFNAAKAW